MKIASVLALSFTILAASENIATAQLAHEGASAAKIAAQSPRARVEADRKDYWLSRDLTSLAGRLSSIRLR